MSGTQAALKRHDDPESPTRVPLGTKEAFPLSEQMAVLDRLLVGCREKLGPAFPSVPTMIRNTLFWPSERTRDRWAVVTGGVNRQPALRMTLAHICLTGPYNHFWDRA